MARPIDCTIFAVLMEPPSLMRSKKMMSVSGRSIPAIVVLRALVSMMKTRLVSSNALYCGSIDFGPLPMVHTLSSCGTALRRNSHVLRVFFSSSSAEL